MKLLVTGSAGFIGQNLVQALRQRSGDDILAFDRADTTEYLTECCRECDFVFHLAGVNRSEDDHDFITGNVELTARLLETLRQQRSRAPVLMTSSIQAGLDTPYGRSKRRGEEFVLQYGMTHHIDTFVYRLPNVFGKWCRPEYNSAVATFCHHIARDLPIAVHDPAKQLELVYVDDVVEELIRALEGCASGKAGGYYTAPVSYHIRLGELAALLYTFKTARADLSVPDLDDALTKKLYATYLSYLPADQFSSPLTTHTDSRGSFAEIFRTRHHGQFSVNIVKPGWTKGNHWHHTKHEKFLVVSGQGVIRFRRPDSGEIIARAVSGEHLEMVDIPPGYAHSVENVSAVDLIVLMWSSECFDAERPDTIALEVT
jgi:UDP-2-acetamido-2,6-beta-L-arabino-hexul-4-ose reductase